jgi:DNA-binding PadR family transcriptional regulator
METLTPTRLPRYKRVQREVDFALTPRDLEILALVESFRLATSAHIASLTRGSNQGILRRLQKLYHAGFLDRLRPDRTSDGGSAKMVYAVTNKGIRELQKRGFVKEPTKTDWNYKNRSLDTLYMRHTLLIAHIRAVLTAACASHPDLQLLFWKEGRETHDTIEVALDRGYAVVPVAPDAFFALQDAKGRMHFFLEADRGTMTIKRFTLKLKAYAAYWQERRHEEKFGIRYFRVLTVTESPIRTTNLIEAASKEGEVGKLVSLFLFTDKGKIALEEPMSFFERVWTEPCAQEPVSILGGGNAQKSKEKGGPQCGKEVP